MKRAIFAAGVAMIGALVTLSAEEDTFPGGIIYGPKAAFSIQAPAGWVLDNSAGAGQGLPCVLYPKGSSWQDAPTIMYAKIASTDFTDVDKFVRTAIKNMRKTHGLPKQKVATGKTADGRAWFINEYRATKSCGQWEQAAYIQLPDAVAFIVLSSRDEASFHKDASALKEVLKSFKYLVLKGEQKT